MPKLSKNFINIGGIKQTNSKAVSRMLIAIIVIVIIVIAGGSYYYYTVTSPSRQPILIGMITPLSGTYAGDGQLTVDGAQLAINQINAQGGLLGHPLKLVTQDEGPSTSTAIAAAQILVVQDKVNFLIGPFFSGDVAGVLPLTYSHKVIEILTVSSLDALMVPPENAYLFRTTLSDIGYAQLAVQWLKQIGAKNAVFLAEDYLYTHEVANDTQMLASKAGINITSISFYPPTASDYTTAINQIASTKPDAVIVVMEGSNGIDFQKQYSANPITSKIPILDLESLLDTPSQAATVDASVPNGMQYVFLGEMSTITNVTASFNQQLQKAFGVQASHYSDDAYDGVMVLANAIKRAGTFNTTAVANAMMQTNYVGPGGHIVFQANHNPVEGPGYLIGTIYQVNIVNGNIYYETLYPPNVANATAINPATGNPYG
ncbi:MAG: ABC transporter substrate-binding protein [Conexivisphaerales archaeon]